MNKQTIERRTFMQSMIAATSVLGAGITKAESAKDRPNILWITCEDTSPHLGCYGDLYAHTPALDHMAAQGVRYTQAYATAPVCTPARSSIITGVYASSQGTQHLRGITPLAKGIHCFTEYLREAGYYCSNNVKEDYNFETPKNAWDESSNTAHWRKKKPGQPFFSVFNFMTTHQSRTRYSAEELEKVNQGLQPGERHDPADAPLPPYYPDTPEVRNNVAAFHTQVTLMDKEVQEILDQLEEDGLANNTIIFFYGDHGDGLPRGKRWLHTTGMQVPLIVRFPEKYQHLAPAKPGGSVKQMVTFADLAPTVLSLAEVPVPGYIQGTAFLGKSKGEKAAYIYGIRDRVDEVLELSRSVRNERFLYIRNFYPHRPRMQRSFFSEITPIRKELRRLHKDGQLKGDETWLMSNTVPAEELYDTWNDPEEMNNLAGLPQYRGLLGHMRNKMLEWIVQTKDTAFLPEFEMIHRSKGGSPYDMARQPGIYPIKKIIKTANMIGRGSKFVSKLKNALSDPDPAVRFWGANGLAALGEDVRPALTALQNALRDDSPPVCYAAAEALCNLGHDKEAVPILAQGLMDESVVNNLHASSILMAVGTKARLAIPQMKAAVKRLEGLQDHGWYTRENLQFMLKQFGEIKS